MRMLIATMFKKVPVRKTKQRACICKRCGVRIYSLNFLKHHLEAHERSTHQVSTNETDFHSRRYFASDRV